MIDPGDTDCKWHFLQKERTIRANKIVRSHGLMTMNIQNLNTTNEEMSKLWNSPLIIIMYSLTLQETLLKS